ncbi:uncharacterized protein TNCT_492981 [Trichonephila clavata]|uniref:Ig-like domain-containing protein n=1 Tax=Trichonephila clavata TaxID=2740835 RepID=A0A8X6F9P2_TRICU|nr:uncharacterized protein TNCT_492981 [Trichonephila clavata]
MEKGGVLFLVQGYATPCNLCLTLFFITCDLLVFKLRDFVENIVWNTKIVARHVFALSFEETNDRYPLKKGDLSIKMRFLDVCLLQLVVINVSLCLRLKYVKIPRIYPSGLDVVLTCDFDLEGETLYAIKWFHDGREFYRYSPEEEPKAMFFPARGIEVDVGITLSISKVCDNVLKC